MWKEKGKRPVALFLLWNFAISWITIGFIIGLEQLHILPAAALKVVVMILICFGSGMSPAYAVFIVLRKEHRVTFKEFVQRICGCSNIKLTAAITMLIMLEQLVNCIINEQYSGLPVYFFVLMIPLMIIGGGLEEVGWRGFLQPALEEKFHFVPATLITGTIWSVWHIPLWFVSNANQSGFYFLSFFMYCVAFSFSLALLFRISHCVWAVIILHAWGNVVLGGMFTFHALTAFPGIGTCIFYGIEIIFAIVIATRFTHNPGNTNSDCSMNKEKILVVNTSEKNKEKIYQLFEGIEIIDTCALDIKNCVGCNSCWIKTPGRCSVKDDYEDVFMKILKADTVIFVSEEKLGMVSFQLKNILDRMIGIDVPFTCIRDGQARHAPRYKKTWKFMSIITNSNDLEYIAAWFKRAAINFHSRSLGVFHIKDKEAIIDALYNNQFITAK